MLRPMRNRIGDRWLTQAVREYFRIGPDVSDNDIVRYIDGLFRCRLFADERGFVGWQMAQQPFFLGGLNPYAVEFMLVGGGGGGASGFGNGGQGGGGGGGQLATG